MYNYGSDESRASGAWERLPGKTLESIAFSVTTVVAVQSVFTSLNLASLRTVFPFAVVMALLSLAALIGPILENTWGARPGVQRWTGGMWAANRICICIFLVSAIYLYQGAVAYATLDIQRLIFYVSGTIILWAYIIPYRQVFALSTLPLVLFVVGLFAVQSVYIGGMSVPVQKQHLEVATRSLASLAELSPISGTVFDKAVVLFVLAAPVSVQSLLTAFFKAPYVVRGTLLNTLCAIALLVAPYSESFQRVQPMLPASLTTLFSSFTVYHWLAWGWVCLNIVGLIMVGLRRSTQPPRLHELSMTADQSVVSTAEPAPAYEPYKPYVPERKMAEPTEQRLGQLKQKLLGQDEAVKRLWENVIVPIAVGRRKFGNALLLGPTGVGKTQTAKVIAEVLYGGRLARFDMNQFASEHDAPKLFGAPPGYVGYGEGSKLFAEIALNAPCVILFDEIEKTHPIALQLLLQLCGEGYAVDSQKMQIDASQCLILMTSNIWPDRSNMLWQLPGSQLKRELADAVQSRYQHHQNQRLFSPEFLGRLHEAIAYRPFSVEIAEQFITQMAYGAKGRYGVDFEPDFVSVMARCGTLSDGYRGIAALYENTAGKLVSQRKVPRGSLITAKRAAGKLIVQVVHNGAVVDQVEELLTGVPAFDPVVLDTLAEKVRVSVKGQDAQIDEIVSLVRVSAAGLRANAGRPYGIFLLAGPTGVGKTETAKALARELFGGRMVKHDMGELKNVNDGMKFFGDRHKPGSLTTAVSELGSCVVLLDEIEKANPEVFDSFLSLFDDGKMSDAASGVSVSFKETIILMTTNLKPDFAYAQSQAGAIDLAAPLSGDVRRNLFAYHFRQELLGRIDQVILFSDLSNEAVADIMRTRVENVLKSLNEDKGVEVTIEESVYQRLAGKLRSSSYGVRGLDVFLRDEVFSVLATKTLTTTKVCLREVDGKLVAEAEAETAD